MRMFLFVLIGILGGPLLAEASTLQTLMGPNQGVNWMFSAICNVAFCNQGGAMTVVGVAGAITRFISTIIGGTAVAVLVYAGIRISMSRGNAEGLNEGKKIATWALVGIAIAIVAPAIMNWIAGMVGAATN